MEHTQTKAITPPPPERPCLRGLHQQYGVVQGVGGGHGLHANAQGHRRVPGGGRGVVRCFLGVSYHSRVPVIEIILVDFGALVGPGVHDLHKVIQDRTTFRHGKKKKRDEIPRGKRAAAGNMEAKQTHEITLKTHVCPPRILHSLSDNKST